MKSEFLFTGSVRKATLEEVHYVHQKIPEFEGKGDLDCIASLRL